MMSEGHGGDDDDDDADDDDDDADDDDDDDDDDDYDYCGFEMMMKMYLLRKRLFENAVEREHDISDGKKR